MRGANSFKDESFGRIDKIYVSQDSIVREDGPDKDVLS